TTANAACASPWRIASGRCSNGADSRWRHWRLDRTSLPPRWRCLARPVNIGEAQMRLFSSPASSGGLGRCESLPHFQEDSGRSDGFIGISPGTAIACPAARGEITRPLFLADWVSALFIHYAVSADA